MSTSALSDYFIEITDRRDMVSDRVSLGGDSIVIGRSYDCEVIVDDPYVCPQHIKVSLLENDELLVEDLHSLNGLSVRRHGDKLKELRLRVGEECYIGWTKIKFLSRDAQVLPSRVDYSRHVIFGALQQPSSIMVMIVLPFLLLMFTGWMEVVNEMEFYNLLIAPATIYIFLLAWAFLWAIAGKILVHRAMFFTHLAIASSMIGVSAVLEVLTNYSVFVFGVDSWKLYIGYVTSFIVIVIMLYGHLHFSSRGKPKRQFFSATTVSAVIMLVSAYVIIENNKLFVSSPRYAATLKPPAYVIGSVQSSEAFFSDIDELEQEITREKALDN